MGRGGSGGSEEFGLLLVSALVWTFLRAGAGAEVWVGVGGLVGPGGLGAGTGAAPGGLTWTWFGSRGEGPVGLGARFGALALRAEFSEVGLVGTKGRTLPALTVWFVEFCVASVPVGVSLCAPPPPSTEALGGRVGVVVCPSVVLFSGCGAATLALGATGGLGGTLESPREEEESLGGGGLGAGTGAGDGGSETDGGFGLMEGLSVVLQD